MSDSAGAIASSGGGPAVRSPGREPEAGESHPVAGNGSGRIVPAEPAPERVPDLELLGEGSGHRRAPCLVRRGDGQMVQLTPIVYAVLETLDGRRNYAEIAAAVGGKIGKIVTADDVHFLTQVKLRPLGLLQEPDGSRPEQKKADPLLGLRFRVVVTNPALTRRIAAPFAPLFHPLVVSTFTLAFLTIVGWLLFVKGLGSPTRQVLYEPGLLLLVFALMMLSAGFHELGHAAACKYGGATPGAMGAALYLVWPAFYTDVSDAYRLDRRARLRVDLGGIYFNAIFAVAAFGLWAATGWDALLVIVPLQLFQTARQLLPLIRLDGYHILADLTGVPDLFAHIKPILTGLLPTRWGRPENRTLKPWVRAVVTGWVLVVVPVLLLMVAIIVAVLPRVAATAWDSLGLQWGNLRGAWGQHHWSEVATSTLSLLAISIPVLSMAYLLARVARRVVVRTWRATDGRPVMRGVSAVVALGLLAGVATMWWPDEDRYRPIGPRERWVLADPELRPALSPVGFDGHGLERALASAFQEGRPPIGIGAGTAVPTIARGITFGPVSESGSSGQTSPPGSDFRFDLPPPPGDGDSQALAVNYEDGTSIFDVALSLVFALPGDIVDNTNEAYALASCVGCMVVAVAFQLVAVLGPSDVVVPENVAVAVNAFCVNCLTYALAFQIVVTLAGPLSDAAEEDLSLTWSKLEELKDNIENMSIEELHLILKEIQGEIVELLTAEGALASSESAEASVSDQDPASDPSPSPSTSPSPSPTSEASPSPSPSQDPSPSPSPSPESSPSSEPSPSETDG